jgi:hypothetical protein
MPTLEDLRGRDTVYITGFPSFIRPQYRDHSEGLIRDGMADQLNRLLGDDQTLSRKLGVVGTNDIGRICDLVSGDIGLATTLYNMTLRGGRPDVLKLDGKSVTVGEVAHGHPGRGLCVDKGGNRGSLLVPGTGMPFDADMMRKYIGQVEKVRKAGDWSQVIANPVSACEFARLLTGGRGWVMEAGLYRQFVIDPLNGRGNFPEGNCWLVGSDGYPYSADVGNQEGFRRDTEGDYKGEHAVRVQATFSFPR